MRKLLSIAILLTLFTSSYGQLGVRAAYGKSDASITGGDQDVRTNSESGFDLGVFYNIPLGGNMSIQPEVHYAPFAVSLDVLNIKSTINNIEVPVLFKYRFLDDKNIQPFVIAGPNIAYALNGSNETAGVSTDATFEDFNRINFSLEIGGGVHFGDLFVDIRFAQGFPDLDKSEFFNYKTKRLNIGVGYMF